MKDLKTFLRELFPAIDFDKEEALIESGAIDSLGVFKLIAALEEEYSISIPMDEVSVENFNSIPSISSLIDKLAK